MLLEEILALEFEKQLAELAPVSSIDKEKLIKQYTGDHDILQRVDKVIDSKIVKTAKLIATFQKKIVETAVAFTVGQGIHLSAPEESIDGLNRIRQEWKNTKMDKHTKDLLRALMVETEAAELFFIVPNLVPTVGALDGSQNALKVRARILSLQNGYNIFPHYDDYGDMDAFTVKYKIMEAGKELDRVDIYMANSTRTGIKRDAWEVLDAPNPALKIPIVFYKQQATEWNDVQTLIDRIEDSLSKNADTNDYFGSPAVKIKGTVTKMPDKGEVGKLFQLKAENVNGTMTYGDIEYMTWDRMPESIKMEYETLKELIYSQTFTPDLSFNNIKGSGNLSGIALKFMFMDAMLKASNKRDILSEGIERRISLFKALVGNVTEVTTKAILDAAIIEFEYSEIAPDNISELVDMLVVATGNKPIISQKTAVGLNPLIQDAEVEVAELQSEVTLAAEAAAVPAGESFSANV